MLWGLYKETLCFCPCMEKSTRRLHCGTLPASGFSDTGETYHPGGRSRGTPVRAIQFSVSWIDPPFGKGGEEAGLLKIPYSWIPVYRWAAAGHQ